MPFTGTLLPYVECTDLHHLFSYICSSAVARYRMSSSLCRYLKLTTRSLSGGVSTVCIRHGHFAYVVVTLHDGHPCRTGASDHGVEEHMMTWYCSCCHYAAGLDHASERGALLGGVGCGCLLAYVTQCIYNAMTRGRTHTHTTLEASMMYCIQRHLDILRGVLPRLELRLDDLRMLK